MKRYNLQQISIATIAILPVLLNYAAIEVSALENLDVANKFEKLELAEEFDAARTEQPENVEASSALFKRQLSPNGIEDAVDPIAVEGAQADVNIRQPREPYFPIHPRYGYPRYGHPRYGPGHYGHGPFHPHHPYLPHHHF